MKWVDRPIGKKCQASDVLCERYYSATQVSLEQAMEGKCCTYGRELH